MSAVDRLKKILLEDKIRYFTDEELEFYLKENGNDVSQTAHHCLILKSQDTSLNISGLSTADTSGYFLGLAQRYKPRNSDILGGGF